MLFSKSHVGLYADMPQVSSEILQSTLDSLFWESLDLEP